MYQTVSKKGDLLKCFTDYQKGKFLTMEGKLKSGNMIYGDKRSYLTPNFTVRELELQRLKNNKSKRSDKNDMMSVKSKGSRFGGGVRGLGAKQPSVSDATSNIGGRSNAGGSPNTNR